MTSGKDFETVARDAYEHGVDPITVAEDVLALCLKHLGMHDPQQSADAARRLTGIMLEIGWTPPSGLGQPEAAP